MYRTTKEENEILTRVGPGTPMGELLRCYWWPVGFSHALKDKPTFIRMLCEDLVLFRDGKGTPGVLAAKCSHRRANLCLGNVEKEGLRCRYHGWLYDINGKILQTPGEPPDSKLKESIQHPSYPAQEFGGLVFAYLGPQPAPLLPRFDFIAGEGEFYPRVEGFQDCNWLQCVENGMDPLHVSFTHEGGWPDLARLEPDIMFEKTEWGIVYKAFRKTPKEGIYHFRQHYTLMPAISSGGSSNRLIEGGSGSPSKEARWSLPIDDTHTLLWRVYYKPANNPGKYKRDPLGGDPWRPRKPYFEPYKEYKESDNPVLGYPIPPMFPQEDGNVLDSIGPIADRENENLSPVIDAGIKVVRDMYLEALADLKAGRDPRGTIRDQSKNQLIVIDSSEKWVTTEERRQIVEAARPL